VLSRIIEKKVSDEICNSTNIFYYAFFNKLIFKLVGRIFVILRARFIISSIDKLNS